MRRHQESAFWIAWRTFEVEDLAVKDAGTLGSRMASISQVSNIRRFRAFGLSVSTMIVAIWSFHFEEDSRRGNYS